MEYLQEPKISPNSQCGYFENLQWRFEYFFARDLSPLEFEEKLSQGWRRFGYYFFRPVCDNCRKCRPIRIIVKDYHPSKSQRRILKKNKDTQMTLVPLAYKNEVFAIYKDHSKSRFKEEADPDHFLQSFYPPGVPAFQSEYYINNKLMAAGFLDLSSKGMSSVYFVYREGIEQLSPGNFSIIKEIETVKEMGLDYYYLGYWIEENKSMAYKNRFSPYELYDWDEKKWSSR